MSGFTEDQREQINIITFFTVMFEKYTTHPAIVAVNKKKYSFKVCIFSSATTEEVGKINSPFPSCLKPLYQSEAWCTTIHMKMSLIYM